MTTKVEALILEKIRADGPITFAAFMSQALYHPEFGYYSAPRARTGWHGHYLTTPELDPAFGELWAAGLQQVWEATGSPDAFEIVEIGPGEGGFAAGVLGALRPPFSQAVKYRLVERSPAAQQRQRKLLSAHRNVTWHPSIVEMPRVDQGVIIANEVLDNLPVHLVERHGGRLQELWVGERKDALVPILQEPSSPEIAGFVERHKVSLPDAGRYEVGLAAEMFVKQVCEVLNWGAVIFMDYGAEAVELAARTAGSLLCYSSSGTDDNPLAMPGDKDITVFANWTSVRYSMQSSGLEVTGPLLQRNVLIRLGLAELDKRLREEHSKAMVSGKGAEAVRVLSRRQALGAMADPGGLGGLGVMTGFKEIVPPPFARDDADT
jgi:SAM-dependent MidA family methyltransferase